MLPQLAQQSARLILPQKTTKYLTSSKESIYFDMFTSCLSRDSECPVCLQLLIPPVATCINGHNICNHCKPSLRSCPVCREITFCRNITLDKLLKALPRPCKGSENGCKELHVLEMLPLHESLCAFNKSMKCNFLECNLIFPLPVYSKHVSEHKIPVVEGTLMHAIRIKRDNVDRKVMYLKKDDIFEMRLIPYINSLKYCVKLISSSNRTWEYTIRIKVETAGSCIKVTNLIPLSVDKTEEDMKANPTLNIPGTFLQNISIDDVITLTCWVHKI